MGRSATAISLMMLVLGAALAALGAGCACRSSSPASLVVTVRRPDHQNLSPAEVSVDGKRRCSSSPCAIRDLSPGVHIVTAVAAGFPNSLPQILRLEPGQIQVTEIMLNALGPTGISVSSPATGLRLLVDGKDVGPLPREVRDLSPGGHRIRVDGNDRLEAYEETVTVLPGQMKVLAPVSPKVKRGLARLVAGQNAQGAKVLLLSGTTSRLIPQLPFQVELQTDRSYSLRANRKGYRSFETKIQFEPGHPEKTFVVDLASDLVDPWATETPAGGVGASVPVGQQAQPLPAVATPSNAALGTLNVNSIPPSQVLLDGRPIGLTPLVQVEVPAGTHTVVFVHPELGRKVVSVLVPAGRAAVATVRFR